MGGQGWWRQRSALRALWGGSRWLHGKAGGRDDVYRGTSNYNTHPPCTVQSLLEIRERKAPVAAECSYRRIGRSGTASKFISGQGHPLDGNRSLCTQRVAVALHSFNIKPKLTLGTVDLAMGSKMTDRTVLVLEFGGPNG